MDRTETYQRIMTDVLQDVVQQPPSVGRMQMWSFCDDRQGHYGLFYAGWNQGKRTQGIPFFARIADGQVHIEHDGIGHGITDLLVSSGIDRDDVILEYSSDERGHSDVEEWRAARTATPESIATAQKGFAQAKAGSARP